MLHGGKKATPVPDGLFLARMDEEGEDEEEDALGAQRHILPEQHVHVVGADVGVLAEATQQLVLELVGHQLHQAVAQGELWEDQEHVLQDLCCRLHLLQHTPGGRQLNSLLDFHAMRESRKTPGNVSMFWRALWGQTLRQSSGWVEVVGGGGRAGGIFMP